MAVNQVDCLKMDCTSPVEKTDISNDQKYSVKCQIRDPIQAVKSLFLPLFFFNEGYHKKTLYYFSKIPKNIKFSE